MKKSTILKITAALAMVVMGYANVWAQPTENNTVPTNYVQHPDYNSGGYATDPAHIDSVTMGATGVGYFVMPDPDIAGSSSFTWGKTGLASNPTPHASVSNRATFDFPSLTSGIIWVVENAPAPASCGGDTTKIDYQVIAKPTGGFNDADNQDGVCVALADTGTYTYAVPIQLTTAVKDDSIRLEVTVTRPNTTTHTFTLYLKKSATSFTYGDFPAYGNYVFTVDEVSDRISRKSNVDGTIVTGQNTFTLAFNKVPQTGRIYHLPNM